jgi:hypothetical protein
VFGKVWTRNKTVRRTLLVLIVPTVAATAIGGCGGEEAGDMEGWQCINEESKVEGGGGAPAVSAYPCKHHHPGKDMHRSRIYLGKGTRASKGAAEAA